MWLYLIQCLVEVVCECGYVVCVFDLLCCYVCIVLGNMEICYKGKVLCDIDVVILCIGMQSMFYGIVVLCQLEMMGVYMFNLFDVVLCVCDKLCCLQIFVLYGLQMLVIVFGDNFDDIIDVLVMFGELLYVIKFNEGSQGIGVVLVEKCSVLQSVIEVFCGLYVNFLVQEFIVEVKGSDLCCFVVGNKVVVVMQCDVSLGEFCVNLYCGGMVVKVMFSVQEKKIVICVVQVLGLGIVGVDLLCFDCGLLLLEVNVLLGFEGIEVVSGVDVFGCIIKYLEQNVVS